MFRIFAIIFPILLSSCTRYRSCSILVLNEDGSPAENACIIRSYWPAPRNFMHLLTKDWGYYSREKYPSFAQFTDKNGFCEFDAIPTVVLNRSTFVIFSASYDYMTKIYVEDLNKNSPEEHYVKNRYPNFLVKFNKQDYIKTPYTIGPLITCKPQNRKKLNMFTYYFNLRHSNKNE